MNSASLHPSHLRIEDYGYDLPTARIAHTPHAQRDESKLLVWESGRITHKRFSGLPQLLPSDTTLVLNDTRVIEARLLFRKETGGVIEVFLLEPSDASIPAALAATDTVRWRCLVGGASKWKHGMAIQRTYEGGVLSATVVDRDADVFVVEFRWTGSATFAAVLKSGGQMPLPPYIKRQVEAADRDRYQTVFGAQSGSVAAPTASLHFTPGLLDRLRESGVETLSVTLHVSAGTFLPVKSATMQGHHMHGESFTATAETLRRLALATTLVAAGTTSLRTLESLYWCGVLIQKGKSPYTIDQWLPYEMETSLTFADSMRFVLQHLEANGLEALHGRTYLLIAPGYHIRSAQGLITNFHQPESTLLLLVAAFVGDGWRSIYEHALTNDYRFLSYGDGSLLWSPLSPGGGT